MIESRYWRPKLITSAQRILELSKFKRWTERRVCLLEREIMIAMFCLRVLIERSKFSEVERQKNYVVTAYLKKSARRTTHYTLGDLEELYDFEKPLTRKLRLEDISNQFIHHFVLFAKGSPPCHEFNEVFVASDRAKEEYLYRISIASIVSLLKELSASYPTGKPVPVGTLELSATVAPPHGVAPRCVTVKFLRPRIDGTAVSHRGG